MYDYMRTSVVVCACVCMCVCFHTCTCENTFRIPYIRTNPSEWMRYVRTCTCVYSHAVYICISACMYAYMQICTYICISLSLSVLLSFLLSLSLFLSLFLFLFLYLSLSFSPSLSVSCSHTPLPAYPKECILVVRMRSITFNVYTLLVSWSYSEWTICLGFVKNYEYTYKMKLKT